MLYAGLTLALAATALYLRRGWTQILSSSA
jgi:hypothetical protein